MDQDHPIVKIKNVGKRYDINRQRGGYIALRDVVMETLRSPLKYLKRKIKKIAGIDTKEEFWALQNIDLEVKRGEVIGIIGPNGSGKSTLLKILSQITPPTTGEIIIQGTVGSLLEVGTGFHPELSGRENIFLNGAILGMSKKEVAKKFDKIVEFAGVGQFLDTPVKYYSSGMYVRLAFSVAAHMEPDILIVDEVLAVGDAEFQKKCLGKMEEVTKKDNRTIFFVSHNLAAIQGLCSKTLLLKKGKMEAFGDTAEVVKKYLEEMTTQGVKLTPDFNKDITFTKIWVSDDNGVANNMIDVSKNFKICAEFFVKKETQNTEISFGLRNTEGTKVLFTSISEKNGGKFEHLLPGRYMVSSEIEGGLLMPSTYIILAAAHIRNVRNVDYCPDVLSFDIIDNGKTPMSPYGKYGLAHCAILAKTDWEIQKAQT